jgi:hypothetical protein
MTATTPRFGLPLGDVERALTMLDAGIVFGGWGPNLNGIVQDERKFAYYGGFNPDGSYTPGAQIVITDAATRFVQRTPDGTVSQDAALDLANKIPMAVVTCAGGLITNYADIREAAIGALLAGGPTVKAGGSTVLTRVKNLNFIGATVEDTADDEVSISIEGTGENAGDPALAPDPSAATESDEFSSGSLDPKWTWDNQGSSTATFRKSRLILTSAQSTNPANNSKRILYQAAPSGSWAIRTRVASYDFTAFFSSGLFVRNSSTGKFVDLITYVRVQKPTGGWLYAQTYNITHWTSPTAAVTNHFDSNTSEFSSRNHFLQIRYDGTTLYFDFSPDNVGYINALTLTASASNVLGGAPDQIGIAGNAPSATTDSVTGFDWFRCYHNANLNQ